jgi:putative tryptophan/tyrosine transport system substrate-binding protein
VLSNTDHPGERLEWNATQQAAQKLSIEPVYVPFVGVQELDNALATVGDARAGRYARFP